MYQRGSGREKENGGIIKIMEGLLKQPPEDPAKLWPSTMAHQTEGIWLSRGKRRIFAGKPAGLEFFDPGRIDESSLKLAIRAYREQPHSPVLTNGIWHKALNMWGEGAGLKFKIPELEYTTEDFRNFEYDNRVIVKVPKSLAGDKNRYKLYMMFPDIRGESVESRYPIITEQDKAAATIGGSFHTESILAAPHTGLTEQGAQLLFKEAGLTGMDINTYILFAKFMQLVEGRLPDHNTDSMLLSSRRDGQVISAGFNERRELRVRVYDRHESGGWLGARSIGMKRK